MLPSPGGVEIPGGAAVTVVTADFFPLVRPTKYGTFDGVAGNPPYIRFGSWREDSRIPAFAR
jgi:tRNA1(Val) A37 N6-methylase TrmN6